MYEDGTTLLSGGTTTEEATLLSATLDGKPDTLEEVEEAAADEAAKDAADEGGILPLGAPEDTEETVGIGGSG